MFLYGQESEYSIIEITAGYSSKERKSFMTFFPPASLPSFLPPSEIHIWLVEFERFKHEESNLYQILSREEQEAAKNFYFAKDQYSYTIAHGTLRRILSQYLDTPADQICFGEENYGKPIIQSPAQPPLHFNLSHSGDRSLVAVAHLPVGVDIEQIRPNLQYTMLSPHIMSPNEQKAFEQLPDSEKEMHFFRLWTRKEAYIKAIGKGLAHPLQKFTISFDEEPQLLEDLTSPENVNLWQLYHIHLTSGYVGTLVYPKSTQIIKHYLYT
jgi:4'-phosphopantetheinyl transferase